MNLPNKITILRMALIPVFMFLYYLGKDEAAVMVFIFAGLTDWADGFLARKMNLISNFGRFMDPLADKLLVTAALLLLVEVNVISAIPAMLIIAREFMVTGLRIVAISNNVRISANIWGKIKTVVQLIAISVALVFGRDPGYMSVAIDIAIYSAAIITVLSGTMYIIENRQVFLEK